MLGLVAERFYAFNPTTIPVKMNVWFGRWREAVIEDPLRFAWITWAIVSLAGILMLIFGNFWMRQHLPRVAMALTVIGGGALVVLMWAGLLYVLGRGWWALALTALITIAAFHSAWYLCGPSLTAESSDRVRMLDKASTMRECRPGPRSTGRIRGRMRGSASTMAGNPRYTLTPEKVVEIIGVNRTKPGIKKVLEEAGLKEAEKLLTGRETAYLLASFEKYSEARERIKGLPSTTLPA